MDYREKLKEYIEMERRILGQLDLNALNEAINLLEETRNGDGVVYVFGNGGSAATASHFQNDFNKGISETISRKYRFQCLNDNMATLMAIANDNGFENVFLQQLENKLNGKDVILAISGSGNSDNVIKAVEYAKHQGNKIIGLTGYSGGKLRRLSDISLHVPIDNMQITEDVHMMFNHMMMWVLCEALAEKEEI